MTETEPHVLFEQRGALGLVTLNRPRAINALTVEMLRALREGLDAWLADETIRTVAIRGAGDRGLCAGGDVSALARAARDAEHAHEVDRAAIDFFWDEYRLDEAIARAPKPYVALMDGIVLGGGVGVSAHGTHRVVTERSKVGMPEVGIGLFPDVGGTWLLGHAPHGIGMRMALTGVPVGPREAIEAGFADVLVPSTRLDELLARLETDDADAVLAEFAVPAGDGGDAAGDAGVAGGGSAPAWQLRLDEAATLEEALAGIREAAAGDDAEAASARETLATIETRSPTSLRVAFQAIRGAAAAPSLRDALQVEYRLARRMTAGHDFVEGVRAQLIDKDRSPRWSPATLDEVLDVDIQALFAPLPADDATGELAFD